jgi:hypothetical protein
VQDVAEDDREQQEGDEHRRAQADVGEQQPRQLPAEALER